MSNFFDTEPDAKAYAFSYRIRVGHELRATSSSELRIEREDAFEEVKLFLDPGEFVAGIDGATDALDTNVGFSAQDISSGDVRAIPVVDWRTSPSKAVSSAFSGLTISIPAGTRLRLSSHVGSALELRFPRDTEVEIGGPREPLREHAPRGMRPVRLHGIPLLEVTDQRSAVLLRTKSSKTAMLNMLCVVSPYQRRGTSTLVHVMEAIGDRVVGGSSIQIRV